MNIDNQKELSEYIKVFENISASFSAGGFSLPTEMERLFRAKVKELKGFFFDIGLNEYAEEIERDYTHYVGMAAYDAISVVCVDAILSTAKTAENSLKRRNRVASIPHAAESNRNVFIIHGHDEAKWRELKEIISRDLGLKPIVLGEQPDKGSWSIIEKFEYYARACTYAIALFTPDDQVENKGEKMLQARPNVIYELGWFCGNLGRDSTMLLLQEGTNVFSDFGGIIQHRFTKNISEIKANIEKNLREASLLDVSNLGQ